MYQDCLSFEIFRIGKQPRCYLSNVSSFSDNVTFVTPRFDNMDFYELAIPTARDTIIRGRGCQSAVCLLYV